MEVILASGSIRRYELLKDIVSHFLVFPPEREEVIDYSLSPKEIVESLAYQKASEIHEKNFNEFVIGADTVVCIDNKILGKPKDEDEAKEMLRRLSGKCHVVYTGLCVLVGNNKHLLSVSTKVYVNEMSDKEIEKYIKEEYVLDKAGAYGIQSKMKKFIDKVEGNYDSIVGLPVSELYKIIRQYFTI